ncbi:MAG: ankyrin repeat domain-containing protein [Limisphaerales bacterium]
MAVTSRLIGKSTDLLKVVLPAAARGDLPTVKSILKSGWSWIHAEASHNRSMLWEAAYKQRRETIEYLIAMGADVNYAGTYYTPLFVELTSYCLARKCGDEELAEFYARHGATMDIHTAAYLGDLKTVKRFLRQRASLLNQGHPTTVREVIDPKIRDFKLSATLKRKVDHIEAQAQAELSKQVKRARAVLDDPKQRRWDHEMAYQAFQSPYRKAVNELQYLIHDVVKGRLTVRSPELVRTRLLLTRRHWLNRWYEEIRKTDPDDWGDTPLHYAVAGRQVEVVDFLIGKGARIDAYGAAALRYAEGELACHLQNQLPTRQQPKAADPNVELSDGCSGNMNATDDPARVIPWLEAGAEVNNLARMGRMPLHRAAQAGFLKITQWLIDRGAQLNGRDLRGETPLFFAARYGWPSAAINTMPPKWRSY